MTGLWALLLTSAALMGSPGPSTISVTAVGAAFGLRRAMPYILGLIAGTTLVLLAVATGVFALLLAIPNLAPVLTAASAVYIVYLAFRIARAPPLSAPHAEAPRPAFGGGLLLAVANPKAYVAIGAVFAGATLGGLPPVADAVAKTAVLTGMIVLIHVVWALAGSALAGLLRDPRASRIVNVALAGLLVLTSALALWPGASP